MTRSAVRTILFLFGATMLSACAGVETGAVSPCHGQFRAKGIYFKTIEQSDGSRVVVSTMNSPATVCEN